MEAVRWWMRRFFPAGVSSSELEQKPLWKRKKNANSTLRFTTCRAHFNPALNRARIKGGSQVARMLRARPSRSGKKQQE